MRYPGKTNTKPKPVEQLEPQNPVPDVYLGQGFNNGSGSVLTTNDIPSINLGSPPRNFRGESLAAGTALTFGPYGSAHIPRSPELSEYPIPLPANQLLSSDDTKFVIVNRETIKIQREKVLLLYFSLAMALLIVIGAVLPFGNEKKEPLIPEELLKTCEGDLAELARFKIVERVIFNEIPVTALEIINLELSCFPSEAFRKIGVSLSEVTELKFTNVSFDIIQENALDQNIGFNLTVLKVQESRVTFFLEQNVELTLFEAVRSTINNFPSSLSVDEISFDGLNEFAFNSRTVNFILSSPKSKLTFANFLTDDLLGDFNKRLRKNGPLQIKNTTAVSIPNIFLGKNDISTVPDEFFSSRNFKVNAERFGIEFLENTNLKFLPQNTFRDQGGALVDLSFLGCKSLEKLPKAILDLNLATLIVSGTLIANFDDIDFRNFPNLESVTTFDSPVHPLCSELADLQEKNNIPNNVLTCDIDPVIV
eukprot:augustus_masked-scaffold_38-processed-gene-1.8-mRNA-1 protein AED:1.00 eAED:1.00 QI:0/-1/0/0/-1/1/1/0/478